MKLMNTNMKIYFNKTCEKLKIVPKYINIHIKCTSEDAIKAKKGVETLWLNSEIKLVFSKKRVIVVDINNLETILS
ncbi:Hypothetical protein CINCED_3A000888 [Cinara cedri]|uniref:Uncharacterized protein n=1 Tax=Cinara cedri TaxID=506608 RepID=A0A5E4N5J6_9HEMI|nr:Hypothetical protein CINCED_3A000888 [Cinara cedri]